jgi:AraC-like DNA-binding protein
VCDDAVVAATAWSVKHGRLAVAGSFGDVTLHHHPVVQVSIGFGPDMSLHTASGARLRCRLVVIASGAKHALHTGDSPALSAYLRPDTGPGAQLNELCRGGGDGVRAVEPEAGFVERVVEAFSTDGLDHAVDMVLAQLLPGVADGTATHPQLRQAVDLLQARIPLATDLGSVARAVALSPDYLGRLFARQVGTSFSATVRWLRLMVAFEHLTGGASVTDAAHLAGFADGAHATRTCRELTGAAPRDLHRALGQ